MITDKQQFQLHERLESFVKAGLDLNNEEHRTTLADSLSLLYKQQCELNLVKDFMDAFKQKIAITPDYPSEKEIVFRLHLILEETIEIAEACGKNVMSSFGSKLIGEGQKLKESAEKSLQTATNLTAVLDGLLDLDYVQKGMVHTFGLADAYHKGFEEVHRSNMSKACESEEEALDTVEHYKQQGVQSIIDVSRADQGIWLVLRESDKKVLKSIEYSPAKLHDIFNVFTTK
jgi:predicted HAD superfamily Cof-like phosphohydrolase